ncbi:putative DNA binding domain-containing protein [Candidatus Pacearchaeota archaeon]|nr:putative DNA binding domain-containing protein [Candidatus Pacearchaeota archaeon]
MNEKEFELILKEGEGQFVEFKENLDGRFAKEIVAFSNASGGRIFFGITDKKEIRGINITNELKSRIIDIAKNCDPLIILTLKEFKNILIAEVAEGKNKPYQCSDGFFMRLGPNSQKLTRDQILEFSIKEGKIRFDEQICADFDFKDFDDMKFEYYLKLAGITNNISRAEILKNLEVLTDKGMSNAGVLFFAKEPHKYIFSSRVRCIHFNDNKRVEILDKKEVDLGVIGNIEFAINYLKERVPVRYEIKTAKRKEFPEYPFDAYRETIINAIIHRDYFEVGEVAVEKLKNQIIINNPGGLLPSFPKGQFGILSYPRNRLLADLLSRTNFMEKAGTGIKRIRDACALNNNKVEIKPLETYFFVEIFPSENYVKLGDRTEKTGRETTQETTQKTTQKILVLIRENPEITRRELAEKIGITEDGIKFNLNQLKKQGRIKRIGPDKGGSWEVKDE